MSLQVEFNNKSENPFTGMSNTLRVFQGGGKGNIGLPTVKACWSEAGTTDQKALVFALFFSIGDITGRQHNLFQGEKRESGGYAERDHFRDVILPYMWNIVSNDPNIDNLQFLNLVTEYTTMDNVLATRVRTKKNTNMVLKVINMVDVFGVENVAAYCNWVYNSGSEFQKLCLAKYLIPPKVGKLEVTKKLQALRSELLCQFCDLAKLNYTRKEGYVDFVDYRTWRKTYNKSFESVLFSTGNVFDLDKEEFFKLISAMPSTARYRTRCKLLDGKDNVKNDKYCKLAIWYKEWEGFKEEKQTEQRVLEEKVRQGTATADEQVKLKAVKKQAKVTTGAINFQKLFEEIVSGTVDKIKVQPFLDKINLPYNTLVFVDDSGSMSWGRSTRFAYSPRDLAAFMATICMVKNPDDEARNLIGLFSNTCRILTGMQGKVSKPNSLLKGVAKVQPSKLIDPKLHFLDNLTNMQGMLNYHSTSNGTNVASIANTIINWINSDPLAIDQLQNYPVWTLISDGNFNNLNNATASLGQLFKLMENKVGFKPYLVLMDVATHSSQDITSFTGLDNILMVPPSPANIEMFLTNFKDIDVYDIYTPLLSIYRSNRYAEVKELFEVTSVKSEELLFV